MSYTPKNNFNLQLGRTEIGKRGFRKKLLADVPCCENYTGYEYYGGFPLETSLEFSRDMTVHGGCPNFHWEVVDSVYFTFATAITTGRINTINADPAIPIGVEELAIVEDNCGHKLVFVILYCGGSGSGGGISIISYPPIPPDPPDDPPYDPPWPPPPSPPGMLCIPDSDMYWDQAHSATEIPQDSEAQVAIGEGINKPFEWSVTGSGFSLKSSLTAGTRNTLIASPTSCGMAEVTVVGCDGVTVIGYVRGEVGHWELIHDGPTGTQLCYEIEGKYKTQYSHACCAAPGNPGPVCSGWTAGYPPCWTGASCGYYQGYLLLPYSLVGDIWEWQC